MLSLSMIFQQYKLMINCKYLKQKLNRTLECKKQNKIINIKECNGCIYRENYIPDYRKSIKKTNNSQSIRTKALSIPKKVKLIVWERDNHQCIFCHSPVPWNLANSHYIKRSHGGLGIPENIFCSCLKCHHDFDDTLNRNWMLPIAQNYLMSKYINWNEDKLVYKKNYK